MAKVDDILRELNRDKTEKPKISKVKDFLSSGSTMVNLSMSGHVGGAFAKGGYYHLVGTSDSGKSYLTLATFAEASISKRFKDYRLIHDNPEKGTLMDMRQFFGEELHLRIEPPAGTRQAPQDSRTIQDFYYNLDDAFNKKQPFVWVLDSMDALYAEQDAKKFRKQKNAARKETGEEAAGNYGMAKAKANAEGMRLAYDRLQASGSILIIIGQAKVDMAFGAPPGSLTFAGGSSLKFYCHGQLWTKGVGAIMKKLPGGKTKQQGINVSVAVKKNRHTGRPAKVNFPIYWSTGIDDTGSMVDWLVSEGHWKQSTEKGKPIKADELKLCLPREELIQQIEADDNEDMVRGVVAEVWESIRVALIPERKMRYTNRPEE